MKKIGDFELNKIYQHNIKEDFKIPEQSIDMIVTSPPYFGLRDYGESEQIGLENSPTEFINSLCGVFDKLGPKLKDAGNLFVNMGDSYFSKPKSNKKTDGLQGKSYGNKDSAHGYKNKGANYSKLKGSEVYLKDKQLLLIPHRFAIEMQNRGWILRNNIIWHKPNFKPDPVKDRLAIAHEYIFHFTKNKKYYYDLDSIRVPKKTQSDENKKAYKRFKERIEESELTMVEKNNALFELEKNYTANKINKDARLKFRGKNKDLFGDNLKLSGRAKELESKGFFFHCNNPKGKNPGDVLSVNIKPFKESHFAVYPEELLIPLINSGCPVDGIVLDPFMGSGTTGVVAQQQGRNFIGTELNSEFIEIANKRLERTEVLFTVR